MNFRSMLSDSLHYLKTELPGQVDSVKNTLYNKGQRLFISDERIVQKGISGNYSQYIGLFESIYQISIGNMKNTKSTFGELFLRTENLQSESLFKSVLLTLMTEHENWTDVQSLKFVKMILPGIYAAGVTHDSQSELVVDDLTEFAYNTLDGRSLIPGESVSILRGCWRKNDVVLEHGVLK